MLSRAGRGRESCHTVLLLAGILTPSRAGAPPLPPSPPAPAELCSQSSELVPAELSSPAGTGLFSSHSCLSLLASEQAAVHQSGLSVCSSAHMSSSPVGLKALE